MLRPDSILGGQLVALKLMNQTYFEFATAAEIAKLWQTK